MFELKQKSMQFLQACCPAGPVGWLVLFTAGMTAVYVIVPHSNSSDSSSQISPMSFPQNAGEMATLLLGKFPKARIVSTRADGQIDRSFILTVRDCDEDTLRSLPRVSERVEQWRGTVLCEWVVNSQPAELCLEEWGEHGLTLPPFLFFGDKELLRQIKEALR